GYSSRMGRWEGALTALSSGTWGDGDAAGFSNGSERETELEQAWLRWSSAELFSALGADGVVLSAGRQGVTLGDGFILGTDMVSMGRGLGDEFDRGGAYYLGGRTAFDRTALVSMGGAEGWRGDLMWLESDNHFQADMELAVANLEHVGDKATFGLSVIKGLDVSRRYAEALGLEERDGMKVYSVRGQGNAGVEQLFPVGGIRSPAFLVRHRKRLVSGRRLDLYRTRLATGADLPLQPVLLWLRSPVLWLHPGLRHLVSGLGGGQL